MANPGPYPPMGPPMGGQMPPPMGGPPPMGMQPRPPMKQGTSKMVPVVVSAGLAVGVFCGLLFGLGTGKSIAGPTQVSNGVKANADEPMAPQSVKSDVKTAPTPKAGSGSAVAAAGSGSAVVVDAGPPEPEIAKLRIELKPDPVGQNAQITVDDQPVAGQEINIPMDPAVPKKKVHVKVRAVGFRDLDTTFDVAVGDNTMNTELTKGKSTLPANGQPPPVVADTPKPAGDTPKPVATDAPKPNGDAAKPTGTKPVADTPKPAGDKPKPPPPKPKPKPKGGLIDI